MIHRFNPYCTRESAFAASCVAFASVMLAAQSTAQESDRVTIDAARCLELESPDERLACFERQVGEARSGERAEPPATTIPQPAPSAAAPAATPPAPPAALPTPDRTVDVAQQPQRERADAQGEWVGSITALSQRMPNRYVVTLDNGQVWEQQLAERYPLQVGQRVRVYQSRWGETYRLQAEGKNGFIQVTRAR
jgi:hypothetical protein